MKLITKTNINWYLYKEFGSYYKLTNGILMFCPMLDDGSREDSENEVDFELLDGEKIVDRLKEIVIELVSKP